MLYELCCTTVIIQIVLTTNLPRILFWEAVPLHFRNKCYSQSTHDFVLQQIITATEPAEYTPEDVFRENWSAWAANQFTIFIEHKTWLEFIFDFYKFQYHWSVKMPPYLHTEYVIYYFCVYHTALPLLSETEFWNTAPIPPRFRSWIVRYVWRSDQLSEVQSELKSPLSLWSFSSWTYNLSRRDPTQGQIIR